MKHLIVDMKVRQPRILNDVAYLEALLNGLVEKIGMKKLADPVMHRVENGETAGITGFVVIIESHISIHTWPEKKVACMDVFSCRDFDIGATLKFIEGYLQPFARKITEVKRITL